MDKPQGGVWKRAPGQSRFPEDTWLGRVARRVRLFPPERLVAVGRVVVATLLLIEVAFVLYRPWAAAAFLLGGYLLFSLCVAALPRRLLAPARLHVFTLIADASILGALVVVGEEPVGAYIVLAAFIVLASAFVWQWRGALVGATGLAVLLIAAGYAHLLIERASEVPVTAAVANGDSAPPLTTGSIGFEAATYFQSVLVHAGYVLVLGAMFATLVVAGRRVAARAERAHMARDLHDTVLQDLTAARFSLGAISADLPKEAARAIGEVGTLLADQQRRIRQIAGGEREEPLAPAQLAGDDLASLAAALGRQWRCTVSVDRRPPDCVPPALVADVGLILREAVANAVQHGNATRIDAIAERTGDTLRLRLSDDGRTRARDGIQPASLAGRVADLGGRMTATSTDAGVVLTMDLPVR